MDFPQRWLRRDRPDRPNRRRYAAFISYSRDADGTLAIALRDELTRMGRSWWQPRALRVFRDDSSLAANDGLWRSITKALDDSERLILLASPGAAQSTWVGRELEYWLATRDAASILIAATEGDIVWSEESRDFDPTVVSSVPVALHGCFQHEPRWVDLRGVRDDAPDSATFRDKVAELAAPMHNLSKDDLVGLDIKQRRSTRRIVRATIAVLTLLTLIASAASVAAVANAHAADERRREAELQRDSAVAGELAARSPSFGDSDPRLSRALAAMAWAIKPGQRSRETLASALTNRARAVLLDAQPDPGLTFIAGGQQVIGATETAVQVWDASTGLVLKTFPVDGGAVSAVTVSNHGDLVAAVTDDHEAYLWSSVTGERLLYTECATDDQDVSEPGGPTVTLSSDGTFAAFFDQTGERLFTTCAAEVIEVWDTASGERLTVLDNQASVKAVTVSPEGHVFATSGPHATVTFWDTTTLTKTSTIGGEPGTADAAITSIAFSPDGRRLAATLDDKTGRLWDTRTGGQVARLTSTSSRLDRITFDSSGDWVLAATGTSATMWASDTGKQLHVFTGRGTLLNGDPVETQPGHTSLVTQAAFSPDGSFVATASLDGTAILWDAGSGAALQVLSGHTGEVYSATFSPAGTLLATIAGDGTARVWNLADGQIRQHLVHSSGSVRSIAVSRDGRMIASFSGHEVRVRDLQSGRQISELPDLPNSVDSGFFSPDGSMLAVVGEDNDGGPLVRLWDVGRKKWKWRGGVHGTALIATAMTFSPDSAILATGDTTGKVLLWNTENGTDVDIIAAHRERVERVAFSPDGATFATSDTGSSIKVWETGSHAKLASFTGNHKPLTTLLFSPDGDHLAGGNKELRVWSVSAAREVSHNRTPIGAIDDLAFSPDGRLLASGGDDGTVRVWDPATGEQTRLLLPASRHHVGSIVFSPDGQHVAASRTPKSNKLTLTDYDGVGLRAPGSTYIWSTNDGAEEAELTTAVGDVKDVQFTADGRQVLTVGAGSVGLIWDVSYIYDPYAAVCASLAGPVDRAAWEAAAPTVPYRPVCPRNN
ncbi:TIR domain-containing protein [Dactylosporangium sp. NPDC049525]|uniref:TIR domain-containing protein n=1 Tax=Dactylosporangium sp. NPDC049525 TaxID=3154730 RepID=UPI00342CB697